MKGCIKVLKDQPPGSVDGLLNALRYGVSLTGSELIFSSACKHIPFDGPWSRVWVTKPFQLGNTLSNVCALFIFRRYTTKHLNDESTNKTIKIMLQ